MDHRVLPTTYIPTKETPLRTCDTLITDGFVAGIQHTTRGKALPGLELPLTDQTPTPQPSNGDEYDIWLNRFSDGVVAHINGDYEPIPMSPRSLEDWSEWITNAIRFETGLSLNKKQQRVIIAGFYFMLRQRGFDMHICDEATAE